MKVYRLCKEKEAYEILEYQDFKNIGQFCEEDRYLNDHSYIEGERYLHFFFRKEDIFRFYAEAGLCICTYDIPDELIHQFQGMGIYHSLEDYKKLERVLESAIPSRFLSMDYLISIDYIDVFIEYEDFINGMYETFVTPVYEKEEKIKKWLK